MTRPAPGARRALALIVLATWAVACRTAAKEATMDEAVYGKVERVSIGRFEVALPVDVRRSGAEFEMRDLKLEEVTLAGTGASAWSAAWNAKLAQIEALKAKRRRPTQIVGEIHAQQVLEPGRFAVVEFHTDNVKEAVQFAALRSEGSAGLWLGRVGDLEDETSIVKTIVAVGHAYAVAPGTPPASAFHLVRGAVALPFQDQERAFATFRGGPLDLEVKLETESTAEPKGGGVMARFGSAVSKAGAAYASGLSPVRNRSRKAAGLDGEEFVMRDSGGGKLYFLWEFKGEANSGARPRIQLQLITKDERQKEKTAFWDALVDSLRPAGGR